MTVSPERPGRAERHAPFRGTPPWDIGRPQPTLLDLAGSGALSGRMLDVGCGTGEHSLMAAALGVEVTGVDVADAALREAEGKARDRGLTARFAHCDVRSLGDLGETFDVVLDSLVFHALPDDVRVQYLAGLRAVLRPGGRLFVLGYSDRQPEGVRVPHGLSRGQITGWFADGWRIDSLDEVVSIANPYPDGVAAWLVGLTHTPPSGETPTVEARVPTTRARRYLAQLGKHGDQMGSGRLHQAHRHVSHEAAPKVEHAEWSDSDGVIDFGWARCVLHATDTELVLTIEAQDAEHLQRAQAGIAARLERIGRRDELTVTWRPRD